MPRIGPKRAVPRLIDEEFFMWDIAMLALGAIFFGVAISYVKGCDLLAKKEPVK